jgi:hypothetical protein
VDVVIDVVDTCEDDCNCVLDILVDVVIILEAVVVINTCVEKVVTCAFVVGVVSGENVADIEVVGVT